MQKSGTEDVYSWWHDEVSKQSNVCDVVWVEAEDPMFLLYTRYVPLTIIVCLGLSKHMFYGS